MIDVYGADEQHEVAIDLERWVTLARGALADEGVRGLAEVSLIFVDEQTITALNRQFMDRDGPT
ncbi:MAG: rRNA maturation RNAse YbeY, partial [Acidobacteriota bacterium]|nr:rRNA maturation RNAse YbeY [Acidobacteriota bacterium]